MLRPIHTRFVRLLQNGPGNGSWVIPLLFLASFAQAQTAPIFQIGEFDRASAEFAHGLPAPGFVYRAGIDAARSWPAQEGALTDRDSATSDLKPETAAAHRIHFALRNSPVGFYRLRIAVLFENPSVPSLTVTVNGIVGHFFFSPVLDYDNGDSAGPFDPIYSHADLAVDIPGNLLHSGENEIALAAEAAPTRIAAGSGFTYDALSLTPLVIVPDPDSPSVQPTIFYRRIGASLAEEVDVLFPNLSSFAPSSQVELLVGERSFHVSAPQSTGFGQQLLIFSVTNPSELRHTQLRWQSDAGIQRADFNLSPAKQWTLLLAPLVHLDIGFTDSRATVASIHSRNIDDAIALAKQHPGFRFNLDGEWPLENYLATRSAQKAGAALGAIRNGTLSLPAQYANLLTGFPTAEVLVRSLYPSAKLAQKDHLPFSYANITDVPAYSWSYASILSAAGIRDFIAAANNFRAPVLLEGHLNEMSPFYWEGPDGQRVLMWYSRHYEQMRYLFGIHPDAATGRETIPLFLQQYEHPGYTASSVIVYGSQLENTDLDPAHAMLANEWNRTYAFPHLEYAALPQALERIKAETIGTIPVVRGDGAPYWEEGILSSAAAAASERETERRATSAEKLSTLASIAVPGTRIDKDTADSMWKHMLLMDEHTVTLSSGVTDPTRPGVVSQLAEKNAFAEQAHTEMEQLITTALSTMASAKAVPARSVLVANPLNWLRDGIVEVDVAPNEHLVDPDTGREMPVEEIFRGKGFLHIRFLARQVPSLGSRSYPLMPGRPLQTPAIQLPQTTLESPFYRVTVSPSTGTIASIFDKELQREIVDSDSPYSFGSYLYVTGGADPESSMQQYRTMAKPAALVVNTPTGGSITKEIRDDDSVAVRMESHALNTPRIETEVRLSMFSKRIDISYNLQKDYTVDKEGVYFAFPFAQRKADFEYEVQTAPVRAAQDLYPGAGHEWFSVQNWAATTGDGFTAVVMPKDSFLMSFGDIVRGQWPTTIGARPGTLLPFVMANYRNVGHPAGEGGKFHFRYSITSAAALDTAMVSKAAWEDATPLEAVVVDKPSWVGGTAQSASIRVPPIQIDDDLVLLSNWKLAEDGEGTVLRLLDLRGARRQVRIHTANFSLQNAWLADAVERPLVSLPLSGNSFSFEILPHQLLTIRLNRNPSENARKSMGANLDHISIKGVKQ